MIDMKIIKNMKIFFTLSTVVILLGLGFALYYKFAKDMPVLNYGIEFTGGSVVTVDIGKAYDKKDIEEIVYGITGSTKAQIQEVQESNEVIIKLASRTGNETIKVETSANVEDEVAQEIEENTDGIKTNKEIIDAINGTKRESDSDADLVFNALKQKYDLENDALINISDISAVVSSELQRNAIVSVVLGMIVMLAYIAFRFSDYRFGISAIVPLLHNVLVVISFYAIFRIPVGNAFIAAILTIVGYSINDTIVVFDRIRENRRYSAKRDVAELVDTSINQVFSRTIHTSITTLLSILILYIMGVETIREFTLPLLVGIVVGTYSSIAIASPLWYLLVRGKKARA